MGIRELPGSKLFNQHHLRREMQPLRDLIKEHFVYLAAPLEDVSDSTLRTLCYRHGADMTFTEMARVEGLAKKNAVTWRRLIACDETPHMVQILAAKEASLLKFLSMYEPPKGFSGFNLNLGCPSPDVISIGQGCAMIKRVAKVQRLVQIIKDAGHPVSIKTRIGLNEYEKRKKVYLNLLKGVDADFFIVHARHGGQEYLDPADFSVYPECVATGKVIIANGDIENAEQVEKLKALGVRGVMIGRRSVSNPAIFDQLKGKKAPTVAELKKEYLELCTEFGTSEWYKKNVLKRLEKGIKVDDNHLI